MTAPSAAPHGRAANGTISVRARRVVLPQGVLEDGVVSVRDGLITGIAAAHAVSEPTFTFPDATLLPGVIDLHVHGSGGWRIGSDGSQDEQLAGMRRSLAKSGVTGFLPTIATAPDDVTLAAVRAVARAMAARDDANEGPAGAGIIGTHLEGPYLNPKRKGAMQAELMRPPDIAHFETLWEASAGTVRYVTLAPELAGAQALIPRLRERDVFVSAGHTDASAGQIREAFGQGVQGVTHLFNAMRGLHHREPGVVGAALGDADTWVELIGDGIHVHPDVMRLVLNLKGPRRIAIVSDTGRYAGLPPARYEEAHRTVIVDGLRCAFPDGTLAGSASPMNRNLMLLHDQLGVSWPDIALMSATNPATMLGIAQRTGSLEVGKHADIIALDHAGQVQLTLVRGRIAYTPDEEVHAA